MKCKDKCTYGSQAKNRQSNSLPSFSILWQHSNFEKSTIQESPSTDEFMKEFLYNVTTVGAFLIAQSVKDLPTMQETGVQFLAWQDSLEKEMATHSCILSWKIPWTEAPGKLQSMGLQELDMTQPLNHHHHRTGKISFNLV